MTKRRLNDLNRSGWLNLLIVVPLIDIFFILYLIFQPGSRGSNDYGPAPAPNSLLLTAFGLLALLLAILFTFGAVALMYGAAYSAATSAS